MSRHVVEKARDLGKEISHASRKVKRKLEKTADNVKDFILTQNRKADKKAEGRERPNLTGGLVISKRAKKGGRI